MSNVTGRRSRRASAAEERQIERESRSGVTRAARSRYMRFRKFPFRQMIGRAGDLSNYNGLPVALLDLSIRSKVVNPVLGARSCSKMW